MQRADFPLTIRMMDELAGLDRYDEIDGDMVADYLLDFFQPNEWSALKTELETLVPQMAGDGWKQVWRALGARVHPNSEKDSVGVLQTMIMQIGKRAR